jgi:predicted nucleic acid-binding protein
VNLVVDASVAVKLVVDEGDRDRARHLIENGDNRLLAPDFLLVEAGNILWKKVRLGQITAAQASSGIADIRVVFSETIGSTDLIESAVELSVRLEHPVYDCIYLVCAQTTAATLVIADRGLIAAADRGDLSGIVSRFATEAES